MEISYAITLAIMFAFFPFLWVLFRTSRRTGQKDNTSAQEGVDFQATDSTTTANNNIAADFQLSTVYPNIAFAGSGLYFPAIINSLSFGISGLLAQWFATRNPEILSASSSLHSFLGTLHRSLSLPKIAAIISLSTFTAIIVFEITFGARFISHLIGDAEVTYFILVASFTLYLGWISFVGGQSAAFATNQYLLAISYAGIHLAIAIMAFKAPIALIYHPIGFIVLLLLAWSLWARIADAIRLKRDPQLLERFLLSCFLIICMIMTLVGILWSAWNPKAQSPGISDLLETMATIPSLTLIAIIVSSFLMGVLYRFVDYSFWDRTTSLGRPDDDAKGGLSLAWKNRLWSSLRIYASETTLAWFLPLLLGLLAASLYPTFVADLSNPQGDAVAALIRSIVTDQNNNLWLSIVLISSIIAVFASTVDTYMATVGKIYWTDLARKRRKIVVGSVEKELSLDDIPGLKEDSIRRFGSIWSLVIVSAFLVIEYFVGNTWRLVGLMFSATAPLLALSASMLLPTLSGRILIDRGAGRVFLFSSIFVGGGVGLTIGITSVFKDATPLDFIFWLANPTAIFLGWLIYGIGLLCVGKPRPPTVTQVPV